MERKRRWKEERRKKGDILNYGTEKGDILNYGLGNQGSNKGVGFEQTGSVETQRRQTGDKARRQSRNRVARGVRLLAAGRNDRKIDDKKMKKRKEEVEGPLRQVRLCRGLAAFLCHQSFCLSCPNPWLRAAASPEPPEGGTTNRMKKSWNSGPTDVDFCPLFGYTGV
jgi:hypothetical protein